MSDLSDKFEKIAQTAIEEASKIECSLEEFYDGLDTMLSAIETRKDQVEEEIDNKLDAELEDDEDDEDEEAPSDDEDVDDGE